MANPAHVADVFIARYGLLALFLMITIEEAGVWMPVPSDLFIIYFFSRAVRTANPTLSSGEVVVTVLAGVVCGSLLLYLVARRYGWLVRRLGRLIHIDERKLERMQQWARSRGAIVIVPVRLIPGLRVLPSIVSGTSAMPLRVFTPMVAVSALVWSAELFLVGAGGGVILASIGNVRRFETPNVLWPSIVAAGILLLALNLFAAWRLGGPKKD